MKIVKFEDCKMRPDGFPGRYHYYALFKNKAGNYLAIALTHITRPDPIAEEKIKNGKLKNIRLKKLNKYSDSGVTKFIYTSNSNNENINPNDGEIIIDKISNYSEKVIKNFALENPVFIKNKNYRK